MRYENVLCVRLADDELRDRRTCEKIKIKEVTKLNCCARLDAAQSLTICQI